MDLDFFSVYYDRSTFQKSMIVFFGLLKFLSNTRVSFYNNVAAFINFFSSFQLKSNCDDLNRELEIVHKHLEAERAGNKNLEDLISEVREKEFQAQLDAQEQKSESQLLRDKLALNESKL